jgi:DNA (cytosine-5)-methyltransferase 1
MTLRVLDLFSGIGGFSLGLEQAGMRTVAFCECDPYCRRVLARHWPGVPIYDDVRTLTADALRRDGIAVDLICGGFPCQDISTAGRGLGLAGERSGLWRDFARLIGELRPCFVVVENVAALLGRGLLDVLGDIAARGYDAEWQVVSACDVGAPHVRERVWLVAYPSEAGLSRHQPLWGRVCSAAGQASTQFGDRVVPCGAQWPQLGGYLRVGDGRKSDVDAIGALGNAVVPQIPELIGRAIMAVCEEAPA